MKEGNKRRWRILVIIASLLGVAIWQANKHGYFKSIIKGAVLKSSDSTYIIRYDSSAIDEVAGNATFYNVRLQSDSLQMKMIREQTAGLPPVLFNIRVDTVRIREVKVQDMLSKNQLAAGLIEIVSPTIQIIQTGTEKEAKLDAEDSLALYQKLIGNYKQIDAKTIRVLNGKVQFVKGNEAPHFVIQGVNFQINNFKVNKRRDYSNLIAYFVKDAVAKVQSITLNTESAVFRFSDIEYNAPKKLLRLGELYQLDKEAKETFINLKNTYFSGLSTNAFVNLHRFQADSLVTDGGVLSFYRGNKSDPGKTSNKDSTEWLMDNDFLNQAEIRNIMIHKTQVQIFDRQNPQAEPFKLKDARLTASGLKVSKTGSSLQDIIGGSEFSVETGGFVSRTKDNLYSLEIGPFSFDNQSNVLRINSFKLVPLISRAQFVRTVKKQTDFMNIDVRDIVFRGADINTFIDRKTLIAESASLTPRIEIFNDRTLPPDNRDKRGQAPHEIIQKIGLTLLVKNLKINNGYIGYEERSAQTGMTGKLTFTNFDGTVKNITNIPSRLSRDPVMVIDASALFMGKARLNTKWELPQTTKNGQFKISGSLGKFDASLLNPVIEPLAAASVSEGTIQRIAFNISGNENSSAGTYNIKYSGLKVDVLKVDEESGELQKKGLISALANVAVRSNVDTQTQATKQRENNKSFFNLLWKSIFEGVKNGALIIKPKGDEAK